MSSSVEWAIPPDNVKKYENLFENMEHLGDKVSGDVMRKFLRDTRLSNETLRDIWELSDLDKDGYLDRFEFILTMHLVCLCLEGQKLPPALPLNLVPPNKRGDATEPLAIMPPPSLALSPLGSSAANTTAFSDLGLHSSTSILGSPCGPPPPLPEWSISKEEQARYASVFYQMDKDLNGLVSGTDVRDFFVKSQLPQKILAAIWDLVDIPRTGSLNQEQFIVAVHLVNEQINSRCAKTLPSTLPPELLPPSLRPVALDEKSYEDSNKLLADIAKITKEREAVQAELHAALGSGGGSNLGALLEGSLKAAEALEATAAGLRTQRAAAEAVVAQRSERRSDLLNQLTAASESLNLHRATVLNLRTQVTAKQVSVRTQEEEVMQLRNAIQDQKCEETALLQRVAERRKRVEAVETENKAISARNEEAARKITNLESIREKLLLALEAYAKLLSGDTSVAEPEEALIQQLSAATAAETEPQAVSAASQSLFQTNSAFGSSGGGEGAGAFSSLGKNGGSKTDPFSPDPLADAFGALTMSSSSTAAAGGGGFGAFDPFAPNPSVTDPFAQPVKAPLEHSKPSSDPNIFDAIFGSVSSHSQDYPFNGSNTNATTPGNDNNGGKKIPPPRPSTQPNVASTAGRKHSSHSSNAAKKKSFSSSTTSPNKSRLRGAFSKSAASSGGGGRASASGAPLTANEAEQLRWATRESQRVAQEEAKLRQKEEADLELALRMSRLEAMAREESSGRS